LLPCYCQLGQSFGTSSNGGSGAVRIVWPGNTRSFPSTCVCVSSP
jgi:hypothetical protein